MWDVKTGDCLQTFTFKNQVVSGIALSSDGKKLVVAYSGVPMRLAKDESRVSVWDVRSGKVLKKLVDRDRSNTAYYAAAFSDDDKRIAAGCGTELALTTGSA